MKNKLISTFFIAILFAHHVYYAFFKVQGLTANTLCIIKNISVYILNCLYNIINF